MLFELFEERLNHAGWSTTFFAMKCGIDPSDIEEWRALGRVPEWVRITTTYITWGSDHEYIKRERQRH